MSRPPEISLILCTYNPDPAILARVLRGMERCAERPAACEYIIVDNNSPRPVRDFPEVQEFRRRLPGTRLIREKRQGLLWARLAGAATARAPLLLFMDDDLIPERGYVDAALRRFREDERLAILGAGHLVVEFQSPVFLLWKRGLKKIFYARHCANRLESAAQLFALQRPTLLRKLRRFLRAWPLEQEYPGGGGMAIRRDVLQASTSSWREDGRAPAVGRQPDSQGGAEDLLMVVAALQGGWRVELDPQLRLTHCIADGRRLRFRVHRLCFTSGYECLTVLLDSLPEFREQAARSLARRWKWPLMYAAAICRDLAATPGIFARCALGHGIITAAARRLLLSRREAAGDRQPAASEGP